MSPERVYHNLARWGRIANFELRISDFAIPQRNSKFAIRNSKFPAPLLQVAQHSALLLYKAFYPAAGQFGH